MRDFYPSLDLNLSVSRIGFISQFLLIKLLGSFFRNSIFSFFRLEEQKRKTGILKIYSFVYTKFSKLYSFLFIKRPLSYNVLLVFSLLLLFINSFVFCFLLPYNLVFYFFYYFFKIQIFSLISYWASNSNSQFNVYLIPKYFFSFFLRNKRSFIRRCT